MKSLYTYIIESIFSDAPMNVPQMRKYLDEKVRRGKEVPNGFIEYMFNLWKEKFDGKTAFIPFRGNGKEFKIARVYTPYQQNIADYCTGEGIDIRLAEKCIYVNGVRFLWGDGSLRGVRAEKGLSYEDLVVSQLREIVSKIAYPHSKGKLNRNEFLEICENPDLEHWYVFYEKGGFDEILDEYVSNKDKEGVLNKITKTGDKATRRNAHNEIFDNEFNIKSNDIEKVLKDSGRIIADVTIDTKTPQYISVKMKTSQLSGVNYIWAMQSNQYFKEVIKNDKEWEDVKDDENMKPFINLITVFGLYPEEVFNIYKDVYKHKGLSSENLTINKNSAVSKEKLGVLFQKLLGGNYWYIKPGICEWVDYKDANLKIKIERGIISDSGKTIKVFGKIDGVDCVLDFRTAGGSPGAYPYRIFPKVNVPELIKVI